MQPQGTRGITTTTNATNIVLVLGPWADGSSWSKVIPILKNAGHRIIAVQLTLHSMADNIATVKRAIEQLGEPMIPVGDSYGGNVISNAAYYNPNVTGLIYVAATFAHINNAAEDDLIFFQIEIAITTYIVQNIDRFIFCPFLPIYAVLSFRPPS